MSNHWTKEQLEAIEKEGLNIIVSAGAGSGKTAVLTERIIRKLKKGININELLVLTFTKAAAHEMKERIREKLKKDQSLKKQLSLLDASYITTFDSFALSVVKKYHYLLNVSQNINICDSNILKMRKTNIIDDIFNYFYHQQDPKFLKLINDFCVKDDKSIKNYILKINDKLDMKYDRDIYLKEYLQEFYNESKIDVDINELVSILKNKINLINKSLDKISNYMDSENYQALESILRPLLSSNNYDEIKENINLSLPRLSKNDDDMAKLYKEKIKNIIAEIESICIWENIDEIKQSIFDTKNYVSIIIDIIYILNERLKEYKCENDFYEFTDIANMSIKLIEENNEIRQELTNNFHEILVDEYQDTNDLQERFISLIAHNNVYMVGDIKQSIYRFRNANPYIFKYKYNKYKNKENGIKIDLNKNFRSREEVLNNINNIFDDIMDDTFGGIDYRGEHRLICGNKNYEEIGKTTQDNNLEIYNYQFDKNLGYKKEEIEIFIIANDIKNKVNSHYQIFDNKLGCLRDITYSDFSILLDRSNQFDLYKKIFTFMKIPLIIYKDDNIASTNDILVIKSILKLISCIKNNQYDVEFKHSFMSVGRSFLCNYSDDELFKVIINNDFKNTEIYKKVYELSKVSDSITIVELLSLVVSNFNIVENLIKIGNINDMVSKIEYLLENAQTLSEMGYNLNEFITYLDDYFSDQSDSKISLNKEGNNACRIMTIHKSKGLEYNICYYANLYSTFNISDIKELFYYDRTYGIITPYINEGISQTIYKTLVKEKYIKEEIEEKIRLFYVALTRCKEKMIMITDLSFDESVCDKDNNGIVELSTRINYRSFKDILLSVADNITPYLKNIEIDNVVDLEYNQKYISDYKEVIPTSNIKIESNLIKIESRTVIKESYSKKVNELLDQESASAINIGNKIHYYLEMLDFYNPDLSNINDLYQKKIMAFLDQDILKDLDKSRIYKEYEFIYEVELEERHGIIDLMLEFDDHIKIIDYKLKDINKEEYYNQLKGYQKYIESITNKPVKLYLYSIIDEKYKEVS